MVCVVLQLAGWVVVLAKCCWANGVQVVWASMRCKPAIHGCRLPTATVAVEVHSRTPLGPELASVRYPSTDLPDSAGCADPPVDSRPAPGGAPGSCWCWSRIWWMSHFGQSGCVPGSMLLLTGPYYLERKQSMEKS